MSRREIDSFSSSWQRNEVCTLSEQACGEGCRPGANRYSDVRIERYDHAILVRKNSEDEQTAGLVMSKGARL